MTGLSMLWLPILVSAIIVFVASSLIHMATPWHKNDYRKLPNEGQVQDALRPFAIPPGDYMMPFCSDMKEMKSGEFIAKREKGPVMIATVVPSGPVAMGSSLAQWFVFCLVVGFFAAYVAGHALPVGARYPQVFRLVGVTAFIGYAVALWPVSIWLRRSWGTTLRATIDGLIYALLTGGAFGWLWPR